LDVAIINGIIYIYKVIYYYTYSQIKFCKRKRKDTFNDLGNDDSDDNDDDDDTEIVKYIAVCL